MLRRQGRLAVFLVAGVAVQPGSGIAQGQADVAQSAAQGAGSKGSTDYVLGDGDQITVWMSEAADLNGKTFRIAGNGLLTLPMVGTIQAAGLVPTQLAAELAKRLDPYYYDPRVVVSIAEYRSQPVSVIGAVNSPGVQQLQGRKTLVEMLSLAGGLRQDAGPTVVITRPPEHGPIPVANAIKDSSTGFSTAQIDLQALTSARNPGDNILIKPNDVISVPRARMVYVIGEVERSGGFVLNERDGVSVLQALSLAGGLKMGAAPKNARILRPRGGNSAREEVGIDLTKLLAGKAPDTDLRSDDILFIPNSRSKRAALRAAEAAVQTLTGVVIWRSGR